MSEHNIARAYFPRRARHKALFASPHREAETAMFAFFKY